jgi:hypothetical protein
VRRLYKSFGVKGLKWDFRLTTSTDKISVKKSLPGGKRLNNAENSDLNTAAVLHIFL